MIRALQGNSRPRSRNTPIEALPSLHKEFCTQRSAMGVERIEEEVKRQLVERYGRDWSAPETTTTKPVSLQSE
jgi:hypothetical protein